jgi:aryl-alcohol dehydrogenase-like predicted oxidoreductase
MERREFLTTVSAAGLLSLLDPAYLNAKERLQSGESPADPVPKRRYGRGEDMISVIGFGGIIVKDVTPQEASNHVSKAVDRGINYFDVAPTYGNAQERLGPALKPFRDQCFLACKTTKRDAAGAKEELEASLKILQTDRFDLYQLHAITTLDDVKQAFAPGGAMETFQRAKEQGKVRHLGFSAHSEEAAHAAMDRHDFDSILFPLGFPTWIKRQFGPSVHKRAREADRGVLAIKAMAHQKWPKPMKREDRPWNKAWYEPFDEIDKVALGLRFTSHLPVNAMIPPGHWELFTMAVELAQSGALTPLNESEREMVAAIAEESEPIFPRPV